MATKNENTKLTDLDTKLKLLTNDFGYMKNDIAEVKASVDDVRVDIKDLSKLVAGLAVVTPAQLEASEKRAEEKYVTKSEFDKLASKLTPLFWLGGVAATAIVGAVVTAAVAFALNGGFKG